MVRTRLPTRCTLNLTPQQIAQAVALVRAAPNLDVDLTRLLSSTRQKVIQYQTMSRNAAELVGAMAAN